MISGTGVTDAGEGALQESFFTAVLLTQNAACAEAAVMAAIDAYDADSALDADFRKMAVGASLAGYREMPVLSGRDLAQTASMLPDELHGVLQLASPLRQCYLLRTLLQWPRSECARMLRLDTAQVDRYARAAALEIRCVEKVMAA